MIDNLDACKVINQHRGDAVVVTTMGAGNPRFGWPVVTDNESLDVPVGGAMGKASSVALGIALAQPERRVLALDGDGSLVMNLGTLTTISEKAPSNLYHFVFENGCYAVTGGQPIPADGRVNFRDMAVSAGYAAAFEFDDLEDFAAAIGDILRREGPILVNLKIRPEIENTPINLRVKAKRTTAAAVSEVRGIFAG